jgi:hypothetical protein
MPLSVSKLPKSALQPLLDDMADRLPVWRGKLMHMSGRLTLIKMTSAVIPIYTVISFHLPLVPEGDVQDFHGFPLDGHRGHARREMPGGWKRVHHPIHLGGLRVMNFNLLGRALRQRWLLLSRMNGARPWALHPVSDDTATESFFQASTSCVIRDGQSTRFWTDPWLDGRCIGALMPELLAMISARARRQRTVASALAGRYHLVVGHHGQDGLEVDCLRSVLLQLGLCGNVPAPASSSPPTPSARNTQTETNSDHCPTLPPRPQRTRRCRCARTTPPSSSHRRACTRRGPWCRGPCRPPWRPRRPGWTSACRRR